MTESSPPFTRGEVLLLAAILLPLIVLRFALQSGPGPYGVDGGYYMQIARNVAEGQGLVTNVCLYHQGLDPLPAPTNIYPLWPSVLGAYARVIGLPTAVRDLPRFMYVLALLGLYLLARRVEPGAQKIVGSLNVAHLMVALFGLTPVFFSSTTFPYTEGLAFVMACAALATSFRPGPIAALTGGLLAALATLTRSQMLMLVFAIILARGFAAVRDRLWKDFLLSILGVAIVLVPWLLYVQTFAGTFALHNLWVSYHQTAAIEAYPQGVQSATTFDTWMLRLQGMWTAFNPTSNDSFFALFGAAALLVPVAAVHWIRRVVLRGSVTISPGVLAIALSGLFLTGALLLTPGRFFREWLFGWRHGLPLIFLIVLAAVELIGFGHRYLRGGALAMIAASILWGGVIVVRTVLAGPPAGLIPAEVELTRWLDAQDRSTVVLTTNAQSLAPYSHANFRWAACDDSPATTKSILANVRTDYVAVYEHEQQCTFARGIKDVVEPAKIFGVAPRRILLLRHRTSGVEL
jgi:hypothetical protein